MPNGLRLSSLAAPSPGKLTSIYCPFEEKGITSTPIKTGQEDLKRAFRRLRED